MGECLIARRGDGSKTIEGIFDVTTKTNQIVIPELIGYENVVISPYFETYSGTEAVFSGANHIGSLIIRGFPVYVVYSNSDKTIYGRRCTQNDTIYISYDSTTGTITVEEGDIKFSARQHFYVAY